MVNNLSGYNYNPAFTSTARVATSAVALHKNEVENLVKYINGQPIYGTVEPTIGETVKSTIPMLGIFGGFSGISALKNNGWNIKNTIQNTNAKYNLTRADFIKAGKSEVSNKFKDVFKKQVITDTNRGFFGRLIDKIPGYKALRQSGFGQMMSNKGTGAGWMAVIDGVLELFTQVIPTFKQVGTTEGFKQIGKSTVKVVAGTAGWVGGDAIGRAAGAAIGTLICPGIGTSIGSFIGGFVGGIVGSAIAGKGARALTGKNELEKHNEAQTQQLAQEIDANAESKIALAQQALAQAQEILAQDPQNAEALAAKASAETILKEVIEQGQQNQPTENTNAQQQIQQPMHNIFTPMSGVPVVPGFDGYGYDMNIYNQYVHNANAMTTPYLNAYQKQADYKNPFIA